MDLHAITDEGVTHVCTIHRLPKDDGPVQIISLAQLKHYQQVEAEYLELLRRSCSPL